MQVKTRQAGCSPRVHPPGVLLIPHLALTRRPRWRITDLERAAARLGRTLAMLHDGGQVHNHLSGESVLLRDSDGAVVSWARLLPATRLGPGWAGNE